MRQSNNETEVVEGVDQRLPEYRRDAFHKFYEFQLRTRGHAGCVYFIFPYLFKKLEMSKEQQIWFMFLNGQTQNPITTYQIFLQFPNFGEMKLNDLSDWYDKEFKRLQWDTDRRHQKAKFIPSVTKYKELIGSGTQQGWFDGIYGDATDKYERFRRLFAHVKEHYAYFGRLSTFSYLEYLFIQGQQIDCDQLFIDDVKGSKSHRNGICKVIGRDDWEWTKIQEVDYKDKFTYLADEAAQLLQEAKEIHNHPDTSYFTLETALCTYKGGYRHNRRYAGCYIDMMHDRIRKAELRFPEQDFQVFWDCRLEMVPAYCLQEHTGDMGLVSEKQNHFRTTGEMVMLEHMFPQFKSNYNGKTQTGQIALF